MESKLGDFVIKYLKEKTHTRKVIKCVDFFILITNMGLSDECVEVMNIVEYLDQNEIDINFDDISGDYYSRFKSIERKVKLSKMLQGSKTEVQKMIEKVDSIQIQERPDWLGYYRDGENDEDTTPITTSERDRNLGQDIIDRLIREQVENEPEITIEEVQRSAILNMLSLEAIEMIEGNNGIE